MIGVSGWSVEKATKRSAKFWLITTCYDKRQMTPANYDVNFQNIVLRWARSYNTAKTSPFLILFRVWRELRYHRVLNRRYCTWAIDIDRTEWSDRKIQYSGGKKAPTQIYWALRNKIKCYWAWLATSSIPDLIATWNVFSIVLYMQLDYYSRKWQR